VRLMDKNPWTRPTFRLRWYYLIIFLTIHPLSTLYSQELLPVIPGDETVSPRYQWLNVDTSNETLEQRFSPPNGFERLDLTDKSFGAWLRGLPLKERDAQILLFNGTAKSLQSNHAAVIDIDCGKKDLQQCADAVIRLNAEYLYDSGKPDSIHYDFTSGDRCSWSDWRRGVRPVVLGNIVRFVKTAFPDTSYTSFRRYLNVIFRYAGTLSLARELVTIAPLDIRPGDVFVQGGSPGHAVLVLDVAVNELTKEKVFMLGQSYMPAQDVHVLINHSNPRISPWYSLRDTGYMQTLEWTFRWSDLKRFSNVH
jgi:Domain of unknown function (4846)